MRARKNIATMSPTERQAFADAVIEIHGRPSQRGLNNRYDDYARIHVDAMNVPVSWGHGGAAFTAWHRVLLAKFEEELRTVDDAYRRQLEVGPAEIFTWARFRDAPAHDYLHAALLAQSTTHWTIAAAMRPHEGVSEAQAHVTLSTGILAATIAFHDEVDGRDWLLYANPAIDAGRGLAQGEGRVFARDGRLVASYTVQAMVREFRAPPGAMGKDYTDAM